MRWPIVFAGIGGALMVAIGAYASHAPVHELARSWLDTGVRYGMWHCLALLGVGALAKAGPGRLLTGAAVAFTTGILLFSGTLIAAGLLDWTGLTRLTPIGGIALIGGWLLVAAHGAAAWRR